MAALWVVACVVIGVVLLCQALLQPTGFCFVRMVLVSLLSAKLHSTQMNPTSST
jgi:hypothetical protein